MKIETFYEYKGDGDIGYVKGNSYPLVVSERPLIWRFRGLLFNIPFKWKIIIFKPIPFAYANIEDFNKDWELKFMRASDD